MAKKKYAEPIPLDDQLPSVESLDPRNWKSNQLLAQNLILDGQYKEATVVLLFTQIQMLDMLLHKGM